MYVSLQLYVHTNQSRYIMHLLNVVTYAADTINQNNASKNTYWDHRGILSDVLQDSLDHVEDGDIPVQPDVVIGDGHLLKGDLLGVLEIGVGLPDVVEPGDGQQAVIAAGHITGKPQTVVHPALCKEYVGCICLEHSSPPVRVM